MTARRLIPWLAALSCFLGSTLAQTLQVAYAGSMGVVMDRFLGPTFAKAHHVTYQGRGQGAYALARLIAAHQITPDVFVSITPGPMEVLLKAGLIREAFPVASTEMVIAYNPQSRFAPLFKNEPWYQVLETPGLRFGRTDPKTDPQGQNLIFTILLAERFYHQPDLLHKILGSYLNPQQIFSEPSLLSRLESGELDATSGYLSAVASLHLPYVTLPPQINLGNPRYSAYYAQVSFQLEGKTFHPQPLVFYAAVPVDAPNPALGQAFIRFMRSPEGQALFNRNGYGPARGAPLR